MVWTGIRATKRQVIAASAATLAGAGACAGLWSAVAGQFADPAPSATARPIPGQTSTPDPRLPAPKVNMDLSHASEQGEDAVNITVDDGPDPNWTPQILRVLRRYRAHATFCMIGAQAAVHPDLVRDVVENGNRLCDHTVSHNTAMSRRSENYQSHQILAAADEIEEASGGVAPQYYRAPGGAFTPFSRQIAAANGMRPLGWNVDSKDYLRPGVSVIVRTVRNQLHNGPTILFHDGGGNRLQTVQALKVLLPWLRDEGYVFGFPER